MAAALQHEAATLSFRIQTAGTRKHHSNGGKTDDALTFKLDQSTGAGQFLGPDFADIFERRKPSQGLQPACVIVGVDEVGKVVPELVVVVIVVALDGRLLDGPVHPLDLTVRPGVFRFRQAMLDAVAPTGPIEWMAAALGRGPIPVPRHIGVNSDLVEADPQKGVLRWQTAEYLG